MSRMKRFVLQILLLGFTLASPAFSLPRFALMTGARCSSCHINPTGGQMRSEYGIGFSADKLPLEALKDSEFTFSPKLSDNFSIGGDYRSQFIYDNFSRTTTFQAMTTSIYGAVRLSNKITFYFKQDIVNGTYGGPNGGLYAGTEVYGLFRILPGGWYVKGGAFLPDYGWKLDDHTGYTRGGDLGFLPGTQQLGFPNGLIFTPNYKDIGVEVGGYIDNFFVTGGLFNGSGQAQPIDPEKDKAYVGKIEYMGKAGSLNFRIGASGYGFKNYKLGGFSAGAAMGDVVMLGEMDWTHGQLFGTSVAEGVNTMAAFAELDYRAIQGLWLIGKFDLFDPQQGVSDDSSTPATNRLKRLTLGLEFFPYSFVEVRPQYRITMETPDINNDVALVQMHIWF
jgi:hypothetical protein